MPYLRRDAQGAVSSLHRHAEPGAEEFVPDDDPQVAAFLGRGNGNGDGDGFEQLDADFVRVLEDLIDTLIDRNVINITDLPAEAQNKLFARRGYRQRSGLRALNLLGDAPGADGSPAPNYDGVPAD